MVTRCGLWFLNVQVHAWDQEEIPAKITLWKGVQHEKVKKRLHQWSCYRILTQRTLSTINSTIWSQIKVLTIQTLQVHLWGVLKVSYCGISSAGWGSTLGVTALLQRFDLALDTASPVALLLTLMTCSMVTRAWGNMSKNERRSWWVLMGSCHTKMTSSCPLFLSFHLHSLSSLALLN